MHRPSSRAPPADVQTHHANITRADDIPEIMDEEEEDVDVPRFVQWEDEDPEEIESNWDEQDKPGSSTLVCEGVLLPRFISHRVVFPCRKHSKMVDFLPLYLGMSHLTFLRSV